MKKPHQRALTLEDGNKMKKIPIALLVITALAGCASPSVYRDPATGNVAQCNASTPGVFPIIAQNEINTCGAAYERMGWKKQ